MKLYDVIKSTVSGVSKTTTINEVTSSVDLLTGTEVKFVYVNEKGKSSSYQSLQLVTNTIDTSASWRMPNCDFSGDSFSIDVITGESNLQVEADKYEDAIDVAAKYYAEGSGMQRSFVETNIEILEGKTASVPTSTPSYPAYLQ